MERYIYSLILLLSSGLLLFANVKVIDTAGCNLAIVSETAANTYSLKSTSGAHNWCSGVFEGLDTTNPTTFSLGMDGTGTAESPGDVSKWDGLWPVYTYGKYWDYNTYIYYTKNNDGYWVSNDIFIKEKLAGNGKTPIQNVIPAEFAEEFLSKEGKYWSAWQEIKDTKINVGINTFTATQKFNSPTSALAMRVPYTYDYEYEYMKKLKQADVSGVTVHEIDKSIKNHNLYIVEISDYKATVEELKDRRVVLMYANEDGDEPDGCWVVNGAMNYLIEGIQNDDKEVKKILSEVTFLFIPLLDPVGWSDSTYAAMTYYFKYAPDKPARPEVLAYAKWIIDWIAEKGNRLDVVVNLHNVECNEASNILCPILEGNQMEEIDNLNNFLLPRLEKSQEIKISRSYWIMGGFSNDRLAGWCSYFFGNIQISYEINSRYPDNRLSLDDLNMLGKSFLISFNDYFDSDEYERTLPHMDKYRYSQIDARNKQIDEYLEVEEKYPAMRNYRMLGRGF